MAQTVEAGIAEGDQVMVLTDVQLPASAGVQVRGVEVRPGQVQVYSARAAYLPDGRFEPARMLDLLARHIDQAILDGYAGLRHVGDMTWALARPPGVGLLAEYEAQANGLYMGGRAAGACLYDRQAFALDLLGQVACAHPATSMPRAGTDRASQLCIRRLEDPYGLQLSGEADLSNRRALAAALDAVSDQRPDPATPIVVDVAGLRFVDAGSAMLLGRLALGSTAGVHLTGCHKAVEAALDRLAVTQLPRMRLTRASDGAGSVGTETVT